jgi:hypothetical protein
VWITTNLGFSYVAGTIRVRSQTGEPYPVEETDPASGEFRVDLPDDADGQVEIDFQRSALKGGGPRPEVVIGEADACIYCGSRSELSDEHVIPYGLEGEYVLRNASCQDCAKITSKFEDSVLRRTLLPARTALKLRTRHKKRKRPERLRILEGVGGERIAREIAVEEHPTYIALPTFLPPALLRGAKVPNLEVTPNPWIHLVGAKSLQEVRSVRGHLPVAVQVEVDPYAYARMIGKIAHGFVAASDLDDVATGLPAAILASDESIGWYVGSAPDVTITARDHLHVVEVHVVDGMVQVRVRLFAQLGGPEYLVLAGSLYEPADGEEPSVSIEPIASIETT